MPQVSKEGEKGPFIDLRDIIPDANDDPMATPTRLDWRKRYYAPQIQLSYNLMHLRPRQMEIYKVVELLVGNSSGGLSAIISATERITQDGSSCDVRLTAIKESDPNQSNVTVWYDMNGLMHESGYVGVYASTEAEREAMRRRGHFSDSVLPKRIDTPATVEWLLGQARKQDFSTASLVLPVDPKTNTRLLLQVLL